MKFSPKTADKKLLAYLYSNSREPLSKISKDIKLSREQVKYRINKFEKDNLIQGYIPLINNNKLGYNIISLVLFKLANNNKLKEFKQKLKSSKNRILTVETLTKYDIGGLYIFKNEKQRNEYLEELLQENHKNIKEYKILEPYFSEIYPLKFLDSEKVTPKILRDYPKEKYKLDEKEKNILKVLNKNANTKIIDIARKTNLSAELVVYKLKKLKKENILLGTRAYFNMEKMGYYYSDLLIRLHNFSKKNQEKLRDFAKKHKNIDSLMFFLGNPNCYMQIFYESVKEIYQTINDLKNSFQDETIDIEIMPLKNEGEEINILPFLE